MRAPHGRSGSWSRPSIRSLGGSTTSVGSTVAGWTRSARRTRTPVRSSPSARRSPEHRKAGCSRGRPCSSSGRFRQRALIRGGARLGDARLARAGRRVLDWLIESETAPGGHLTPVGNHGWWLRDGPRAQFDQQPIETTALLLAAAAAYETTGEARYREAMETAYAWFLGANDVAAPIAKPERGACHDSLTPSGVNENQGAESTLMWLIALEEIRSLRGSARRPTTAPPGVVVGAS